MFSIFSSYISVDYFKLNVKKYKKEILNLKLKNNTVTKSNYGGWQSVSFEIIPDNFIDLFNEINNRVKKIEENLSLSKELKFHNCWYNVNGLGSFNRPHVHPGAVVSGVYYISIPKNSGSIVFVNNDLNDFNDFYGLVNKYNEYNSPNWIIEPKENTCVLFPSYLTHYVEPNLNKKERISISFNYGF